MNYRYQDVSGAVRRLGNRRTGLLGAATATALVALAIALPGTTPDAAPASAATTAAAALVQPRQSFADLVERVQPAVVNVATRSRVENASAGSAPFDLPEGSPFAEQFRKFFERRFPGAPGGAAPESQGVGSGFIIDASGHVVTNYHVVKGANEIQVTLHDGTEVNATVVGHDDKTDLAVLKLDHDGDLPFVAFGDSDSARVGDWVVAVGSPFGLGGTVTAGILSARGRDIHSGPFDDFLQVDAPINRGNSGGPLFDQSGQVIGVNTAIFSPSGGNVGIGFAIPSELASEVVSALIEDGRVKRGWMGVNIQSMSAELAESFGLDAPRGALVAGVMPDSPADKSGIEVGDVIVSFNGEDIETMRELPRVVASARSGSTVDVVVIRAGDERKLSLQVGNMPGVERVAATTPGEAGEQARLGVRLAALDGAMRERLGLEEDVKGVVISEVARGGAAARQGLRPGDVILRIGKDPVSQPSDVLDALRGAKASKRSSVVLLVSRNGNERFVAVPFNQG